MTAAAIPPSFAEHADDLRTLRGRERTARRRELEQLFQVSSSTMSRWMHSLGIVCHERSDKGQRKLDIREEHLRAVFAIQYSSYKKTQGLLMAAIDAIEIAERNGRIPAGVLTASTYNAWLRTQGISRAEIDTPEPHRDLISLGPNHVHQVDFSLAINWKVKNNRAVYEEYVYKNKLPAAGEPRLLRLILTDHTSGAFFVWYTVSPGENIAALLEGLWRAWTEKTHQGESIKHLYPFRGVPRILMMDRGPGSKTQILHNFLDWLGIKLSICEGARSKGQVEGRHWWWEQRFESRFRLDPVTDVARLCDEANAFAARLCKEHIHSRTGAAPTAHWEFHLNRSFETQLRVPNCTWSEAKRHAVSPEKAARVGGSGIIEYRGQRYRVPEVLLSERKVGVHYSPFEFPNVYVRSLQWPDSAAFICEPLAFNEHGFPVDGVVIGAEYKGISRSQRAVAIADAEQALRDAGVKVASPKHIRRNATGEQQERFETRGYHLEGLETSGIKSRETPVEATAAAALYSRVQARDLVRQALGGRAFTPAEAHYLVRFGEQVTQEEIDEAVAAIEQGILAPVVGFGR